MNQCLLEIKCNFYKSKKCKLRYVNNSKNDIYIHKESLDSICND